LIIFAFILILGKNYISVLIFVMYLLNDKLFVN